MSEDMERVKVIAFQKEWIDAVFDIQRKAYKPLFDEYHAYQYESDILKAKKKFCRSTPAREHTAISFWIKGYLWELSESLQEMMFAKYQP